MKFNKLGVIFLVISFIFSKEKEQSSTSASMGSVTLDGKIYNQVAIRPEIPIGKLGIGLDLYLYFNDEGLYPGNWDFSDGNAYSTLIDKIYYLRWGKPSEKLYFMLGALPNATLGQGILVNNYSNIMEYPQVRRIGLDFKMKFMKKFSLEFIHSNFKKSAPGVLASRFSYDPFPRLSLGISYVTDLDQNQGLVDRDDDGYPDYFDHYPDDPDKNNEALETYNNNRDFWDSIVPDGEEVDPYLISAGLNYNTYSLDSNNKKDPISGVSFDLVLKLSKRAYIYSQYGQLIGETLTNNDNDTDLGYGIVPIGFSTKLGPVNFRGEYRMQSANFVFSYWDQAYDLNRAIAKNGGIVTKESQLFKYGKLNGLFLNMNSSIMNLLVIDFSYQNMSGEVWKDDMFYDDSNQTLIGKISLNTKNIAKVDLAEAFYQQSNVLNPFDFDPNESTLSGYNLGFEVSSGMTLVYKNRTTYVLQENGNYDSVSSMQIETQIKL